MRYRTSLGSRQRGVPLGVGKKWSFAFRGGTVPGRRARDQSLVELRGTSPWQKGEGPVPGSIARDQSLIEESGTFNKSLKIPLNLLNDADNRRKKKKKKK